MIYGAYKNIRDAAWKCLIDYKIKFLPVDLLYIVKTAGIKLVKNSDVNELSGSELGKCRYDDIRNKWYLIYNDECPIGMRRFTIAHELAHILLGHELIRGELGRTFDANKPQLEREADMFAARLLSPACVLRALDIYKADDIVKFCGVSYSAAKIRSKRMLELYKRDKFLTSAIERQVYEQFKDFIEANE